MAIITERIEGKIISVEINSTNLKYAVYNTEEKTLQITFKNNSLYEYEKVPWSVFTKLRMSESQGKFFNTIIRTTYTHKKIK